MHHPSIRLAAVYAAAFASAARGDSPSPPPVFVGAPYVFTVDVSPPGPQSFEYIGQVTTSGPAYTVTVDPAILPPKFSFASTPGNPATFTVSAAGLTYADTGRNQFGISAIDDAPNGAAASVTFTVNVVPEPAAAAALSPLLVARRRRRHYHEEQR